MIMQHDIQWTLQWDTREPQSYEGRTKTRIYNSEEELRQNYERRKNDPTVMNLKMFKLITTVEKITLG